MIVLGNFVGDTPKKAGTIPKIVDRQASIEFFFVGNSIFRCFNPLQFRVSIEGCLVKQKKKSKRCVWNSRKKMRWGERETRAIFSTIESSPITANSSYRLSEFDGPICEFWPDSLSVGWAPAKAAKWGTRYPTIIRYIYNKHNLLNYSEKGEFGI